MSKRIENYDEMSDPDNPITIKFEDIQAAETRIRPYIMKTPCINSHQSKGMGLNIIYKMESVLPCGCHKERGAVNALVQMPRDKKKSGIVISSLGNHGTTMAYHAGRMNIPITAMFPDYVPIQKLQRIHGFGAKFICWSIFKPTSGQVLDLEVVRTFVYLGSQISDDSDCDQEVVRRSQMAKTAVERLERIWKNRSINRKTEIRLMRTLVFSIFLYAEHWELYNVLVRGNTISDTNKMARAMAKEKGFFFIHGRDHPHILAGNGTIALEILEQVPNVDAVLVPVGTGGLIGAIGIVIKRMKPNCLVYGVQSELMPVFTKALEAGKPVNIPEENTIADTLQMSRAGTNAFHNAKDVVDKMLLVKEDWIARAILGLIEQERFVVEGAGACPLAAILGHLVPELKTKNVVCVVTGGNIDSRFLTRVLDRGLAAEGRLIKFKVGIKDSSDALANMLKMIADNGFNVVRFFRDAVWSEDDVYHVEVRVVVEARNMEHAMELKRMMDRAYAGLTLFDTEPFNDKSMCPCYVAKVP